MNGFQPHFSILFKMVRLVFFINPFFEEFISSAYGQTAAPESGCNLRTVFGPFYSINTKLSRNTLLVPSMVSTHKRLAIRSYDHRIVSRPKNTRRRFQHSWPACRHDIFPRPYRMLCDSKRYTIRLRYPSTTRIEAIVFALSKDNMGALYSMPCLKLLLINPMISNTNLPVSGRTTGKGFPTGSSYLLITTNAGSRSSITYPSRNKDTIGRLSDRKDEGQS